LALRAAWLEKFPSHQPALILGFLEDKDWSAMARLLAPLARRVLVVPVHSKRSLAPELLAAECRQVCPELAVEVHHSLADALRNSAQEPFVLIAGSLYLIGEAMDHLGLETVSGSASADERDLNEWRKAVH
jgi:folylpolyglutamate synthase/dihydropteroate synthase